MSPTQTQSFRARVGAAAATLFTSAAATFAPADDGQWTLATKDGSHQRLSIAVGSGALSSLAIAAMWLPQWVLSPCAS